MRKILLMAGFSLQESVRRRVVQILLVIALLLIILFGFAMRSAWTQALAEMPTLQAQALAWTGTKAVLGVLNFLVTGAAVFLAAGSISGEVESGSLHVLLPRTITRTQLYLGRLLALVLLTVGFGIALAGGVGLTLILTGPGWPPGFGWVLLFFAVPPLFLVVLAQALSTRLGTVGVALIGVVAWVLAQVGTVMEAMGAGVRNATLESAGILVSLLIPVDAVYRWMTERWTEAMGPVGALLRTMDTALLTQKPSVWMLVWAAGWALLVTWLGIESFRARDL